jgi:Fe-S cluster assembly protein SufD
MSNRENEAWQFAPIDKFAPALAVKPGPEANTHIFQANHPEVNPVIWPMGSTNSTAAAANKLVIQAEAGATGVLVLDYRGGGLLNEEVVIEVGDDASLTVVSLQNWNDDAIHNSNHVAVVGRDAHLKHVVATFGGDAVRITPSVELSAPGGHVEMLGLYFTDAGQYQEHRLFVDHNAPNCTSRVTYKGALQGLGAHAVWVGDVLIRPNAIGTDTYELNRNLILTKGARADSVPNLEIETGEIVGAGHASATGRFDDQQLFYLMARGIPEAEARRLVVRGFFAELVGQIGVPEVETMILRTLETELENARSAIENWQPESQLPSDTTLPEPAPALNKC